jgi:hypothetical protein
MRITCQTGSGSVIRRAGRLLAILAAAIAAGTAATEDFRILSVTRDGALSWSGAFPSGVCTIEAAPAPTGPWLPQASYFTTASGGMAQLPPATVNRFHRLVAADVSPTPQGFENLTRAYGRIRTVAGLGQFGRDGLNNWLPEYEGGPATNANLSRPHFAMADAAGNIYIADKDSHSILEVTLDGMIHTVAGTHQPGDDGDGPAPATSLSLSYPNGEWVKPDGTVYILDTGNSKIRKLDTNGIMTTLATVPAGITVGRGLWVNDNETLAYFISGTAVRRWTPAGGFKTLNDNFKEPGNLVVDPAGRLIVTDRGAHRVYHVKQDGSRDPIAGNGGTTGGGDGFPALDTGLYGVRGVWFLPAGGYLLATHQGSQIWYVDAAGIIHLFVDGAPTDVHDGDGGYFRAEGPKISEVRSVSVDPRGNVLITENDFGYIRQIDLLPFQP